MPTFKAIFPEKLARLVGTPRCPLILGDASTGTTFADRAMQRPTMHWKMPGSGPRPRACGWG